MKKNSMFYGEKFRSEFVLIFFIKVSVNKIKAFDYAFMIYMELRAKRILTRSLHMRCQGCR